MPASSSWAYSAAARSAASHTRPGPAPAAHVHAAARAVDERTAERAAREEVRAGHDDPFARRSDRLEVGAFDRAPVAQVVAQQQCGARAVVKRRRYLVACRCSARLPARPCRAIERPPKPFHRESHRRDDRPWQSTAKSKRGPSTLGSGLRMMVVVDDVDATDERDLVIDQRQLAVQPAQQLDARAATNGPGGRSSRSAPAARAGHLRPAAHGPVP